MQVYAGAYAFIENCYFKNISKTFLLSNSDGKKAAVKSLNNVFDNASSTNATIVTSRTATVTNGNLYGQNFDTDSSIFYYANGESDVMLMETAQEAVDTVKAFAGALKETTVGGPITVSETFTVTYVTNCDTTVAAANVKQGRAINLPTITRTGYYIEGWYTEAAFTNKVTSTTVVTANMTVYAKWEEITTGSYTTLYDITGKTETISSTAVDSGWYYTTNGEGDPTSTISSSISNGKLSVNDTSSDQTNITYYKINEMTSGSIKVTASIKLNNVGSKWSIMSFNDGSKDIALRLNSSKCASIVNDGGNEGEANGSAAVQKGATLNIEIEVNITSKIVTATINGTEYTLSNITSKKITGIQFMTGKSATDRSFDVTYLKIEIAQ